MRKDFTKLGVWRRAHVMVLEIYKSAKNLPESEQEGLALDVRNAALAVPANIARGSAFEEEDDYRECLGVALESAKDVENNLMLMRDLGYIFAPEHDRLESMAAEVRTLLRKELTPRRIRSS
jgi:four helix bundle protein